MGALIRQETDGAPLQQCLDHFRKCFSLGDELATVLVTLILNHPIHQGILLRAVDHAQRDSQPDDAGCHDLEVREMRGHVEGRLTTFDHAPGCIGDSNLHPRSSDEAQVRIFREHRSKISPHLACEAAMLLVGVFGKHHFQVGEQSSVPAEERSDRGHQERAEARRRRRCEAIRQHP